MSFCSLSFYDGGTMTTIDSTLKEVVNVKLCSTGK